MLSLHLHEFRCWSSLSLTFPIGQITLIKGTSGIGKSTIFAGITWCLFGNLRLVAPHNNEKAKTSVSIAFPATIAGQSDHLQITRTRNPQRLILNHGTNTYEDKVAQALINHLFGSQEVWLSSCYIGQGVRNTFLTAPNSGKMELLNAIAFNEEDPTTFIAALDLKTGSIEHNYNSKLQQFNTALNNFTTRCANNNFTLLTAEQEQSLHSELIQIKEDTEILNQQHQKRQIQLALYQQTQLQLKQLQEKFADCTQSNPIEPYGQLSLSVKDKANLLLTGSLQDNIQKLRAYYPILQRLQDLHREMQSLSTEPVTTNYTEDDYTTVLQQEQTYTQMLNLAQKLQVPYQETAINEAIKNYQLLLYCQDMLKSSADYKELLNKYESALQVPQKELLPEPTITEESIIQPEPYNIQEEQSAQQQAQQQVAELTERLKTLEKSQNVLHCPYCSNTVKYISGKLEKEDVDLTAVCQQISEVQNTLSQLHDHISNLQRSQNQKIEIWQVARQQYQEKFAALQTRLQEERQALDHVRQINNASLVNNNQRQKSIDFYRQELEKLMTPQVAEECLTQPLLSAQQKDQTYNYVSQLQSLQIVAEPSLSSQIIRQKIQAQDQWQKYLLAQNVYQEYLKTQDQSIFQWSLSEVSEYIQIIEIYLQKNAEYQRQYDNLKLQIVQTQAQLNQIEIPSDVNDKITALRQRKVIIEDTLEKQEKAKALHAEHEQITQQRNEVLEFNNQLTDAHTLRQLAVDTECLVLQQVVDSINTSISGVCASLFDNDISIALSLFKTLKSTKSVKPLVNFSISYQGGVYDTINQMSGGEGDRASLALTLALNRLSASPLLMFDESLASLDLNSKTSAIATIRENTNHTVIIIQHDGVEGVFDEVIDLSTYAK